MSDTNPMDLSHTRPKTDNEITSSYTVYRSMTIDYSFIDEDPVNGIWLLKKALMSLNKSMDNSIGWICFDNGLIEWPEADNLNHSNVDSITEEMIIEQMYIEKAKFDSTKYQLLRRKKYPKTDELIIALWEKVMEDNSVSADELQELRLAIKEKYPKSE